MRMRRATRVGRLVTAAGCLLAAACDGEGGELREATRARELAAALSDSVPGDSLPPPMVMDTLDPQIPVFTDPSLAGAPAAPGAAPVNAVPQNAPGAPATPSAPATRTPASTPGGAEPTLPQEWTAGVRQVRRSAAGPARVVDVRTARNEGFDRVVLQIDGARVPGYRVEYVERPVRQCGSGNPVEVAGQGLLAITLNGAAAHDDRGNATVRDRERRLSLPVMRELEFTCDFEGEVTLVVGVASPNRYRVIELSNPTRLAVDVQHQ